MIISYSTHGLIKGIPVMIKDSGILGIVHNVSHDNMVTVRIPNSTLKTGCYYQEHRLSNIQPLHSPVDIG
jgi:hypothetical protein